MAFTERGGRPCDADGSYEVDSRACSPPHRQSMTGQAGLHSRLLFSFQRSLDTLFGASETSGRRSAS